MIEKLRSKVALSLFATLALATGCKDKGCTDNVPYIEFRTLTTTASSALLTFYFRDCDGDIGNPNKADTAGFNLFLTYYQKKNGNWEQLILPEQSRYKIPEVTSKSNSDKLEGEIDIDLTVEVFSFASIDTLKIEFYLQDNAGNNSNTQESNPLIKN